jgi:hypothetical protein
VLLIRNTSSEAHLGGSNIKDGNDIVEECIAKDEAPFSPAIDYSRQAEASIGIDYVLVNQVLGADAKGCPSDGDAEVRGRRVAGYKVRTLVIDVDSRRHVSCENGQGDIWEGPVSALYSSIFIFWSGEQRTSGQVK